MIKADLSERIRVGETEVGKAVFAASGFQKGNKIARIDGEEISDPQYGSSYCMALSDTTSLEPAEPFRFLNHSCQPNCELVLWEDDDPRDDELCLHAVTNIQLGDELTIDYGWPAQSAIPCRCGAQKCRGWIVSEEDLSKLAR
jgi:hypothetical protein